MKTKSQIQAPFPVTQTERAKLRALAGAENKTTAQFLRDAVNETLASRGEKFRLIGPNKFNTTNE